MNLVRPELKLELFDICILCGGYMDMIMAETQGEKLQYRCPKDKIEYRVPKSLLTSIEKPSII